MFSRRRAPNTDWRGARVGEGETGESKAKSAPAEGIGLFVLSTGVSEDVTADVIAIHGLGGHAFSTWTDSQGHMWLRDSLPKLIPQARFMTFGYDSVVFMSHSTSGVADFAIDLLERIRLNRQSAAEANRDIVFVCHSLGGIVCKKALVIAHERPEYAPILDRVRGVIFMGTPHRGSRLASLAKPLANIINASLLSKRIRSDLLGNLQNSSSILADVSTSCVHRLASLRIVSFYEQNFLEPLGRLVVEPFSAILDLPNERALPISADHRSMVRFSVLEEEKFRPVWNAIAELIRAPESTISDDQPKDGYINFLRELYYMDYTRYLFDAPQPHRGTCSWIFENSAFLRWIEDPLPSLFWLHGLPGRGKTVLARYIVETLKTNDVAFTHLQGRKLPIAHYFCLAQDQDRGSQLAVLRSILHQLLLEEPSLHGALNHTVAKYGRDHDAFSNTLGLWDALEVVLSTASLRNTFIVVDALDEMEPTNLREFLISLTNMINHLQEDRPNQQIKIFVTSQPNIEIAVRFESHIATECEIPSADVRKDLEAFVKNTVSRFGEENAFPSRVILRIESEIILKADGMFLWASLAWAHFREGVTMWSEGVVEKRLALLKMLPKGLEPLYGEMLQNVDLVHSSELLGLFGCILTACRPLSCPEIAEALAVKEGHKSSSDLDVAFSVDVTIKRTCPNLVKIDVAGAVSFTHQSIKEFYMQHWVGSRFQAANRRFALTCLRYLNFDDIERVAEQDVRRRREECCILSEGFPLFSYASQHLVDHLRAVSYDDDMWLDYSRMIQKKALFHATSLPDHSSHGAGYEIRSGKSPLKVAISTGSTSLVKRLVNHGYNINERYTINPWNYFHGSRGGTPLHDFMEEPDWADLLLELGASPNEQDMLGRTPLHLAISTKQMETINKLLSIENIDLNIRDSQGCTALHWAVTKRMVTVIHNLLKDQRVNVNIEDNDGRTPFTYAAYWGDQSIMVELLKSSKALLAHQELSGLSPVICAAQHRWKDMTVDLIRMVPDINVHRGLDRKGIIHWAVINEWDDVLVLAVEQAGAKLNHIDTSGKTPLHYAAELGIPTAARRLLRCGASVHISDNNGRTALHAAAIEGFADVLNVLLQESKFDVNEEDHQRRSLVHWAASWDWVSIMTLVLEQPDLDVVKKDGYGRTALHVAALCGCPNVLEKLLGLDDFDVTETDGFGNTLLHLAARGGSVSVTNMLLDLPALWRHRVNYWGQTALDCASIYNTLDVMEVLRKAGLRFQVAEDPLLRPRPAPTVECSDHSPISYNADGSIRAGILIRMGTEQKSSRDRLKEMRRPPVPPVTPPQDDRWTSYGEDETDWNDESNSNEYRRYSLDDSGLDPYRTRQRGEKRKAGRMMKK